MQNLCWGLVILLKKLFNKYYGQYVKKKSKSVKNRAKSNRLGEFKSLFSTNMHLKINLPKIATFTASEWQSESRQHYKFS